MARVNRTHLLEILDDLQQEELKTFQWYLQIEFLDGFNPISKAKLEKADRTDTVDKMVGAYKLEGALKITVEILKKMNRNDLSEKLGAVSGAEEAGGNSSTSCLPQEAQGSCNTETAGCAAASGGNPSKDEQQGPPVREPTMGDRHFVDIHRAALIQRVTSVAVISDDLLGEGVLNKEKYNNVNTQGLTNEDKMRRLYDVISASGRGGKDLFFKSLQKHEQFIVNDLRG